MIRGTVFDMRPTVQVTLHLPGRGALVIEFVVDTGFQGALALPPDAVAALGLPFDVQVQALPASGLPFQADLHRAIITWDGQQMMAPVLATGTRPLLGTALLKGYDLRIAFEEGGEVRIDLRP